MKTIIVLICIFLTSMTAFAKKDKLKCRSNELKQGSCYIKSKAYEVKLSRDSMIVFDGVRRAIYSFPLSASAQWEKIEWQSLNNRNILQIYVWGPKKTEASLQSLHWIPIEIKKIKTKVHFNKIIQKRRISSKKNRKFIYDPKTLHGLKAFKRTGVRWFIGEEKGLLEAL